MNVPPIPPVYEEPIKTDLILGKFEYVSDINDRKMLSTAYSAINITETWDFIYHLPSDFSLNSPEINAILNTIEQLGYSGHSGSSFRYVINTMHFISKKGELKFKEQYF